MLKLVRLVSRERIQEAALVESDSRSLFDLMQKSLPLITGQEFEEP